MSKISEHFSSEEFLSDTFHSEIDLKGLDPRWYIDRDIVNFLEWIRSTFDDKTVVINNWKWGGTRVASGLRDYTITDFSYYSQHRFKDAVDFYIVDVPIPDIHRFILDHSPEIISRFGITTIEKLKDTPTWIHIDKRWTDDCNKLLQVNG